MDLKDIDFQTRERVNMLVEAAGGQTKLAHILGFTPTGGKQRVQNWINDGRVPIVEVLRFNKIFKKLLKRHENNDN